MGISIGYTGLGSVTFLDFGRSALLSRFPLSPQVPSHQNKICRSVVFCYGKIIFQEPLDDISSHIFATSFCLQLPEKIWDTS